ncbi:MAG TPA: aminotransferase class V-fold PLP-dependent enzyme [Candidatus Limnocylindrales bacterium]|nr:aminotransferase class V-fold PLP-dependent enzyme [Candidatus Limnocylindrales bacterium]
MVSPNLPEPERLAAVRRALPATSAGIYLNTGTAGPMSTEVAAAMAEQAERELTVGRGHPDSFVDLMERIDEARGTMAALLASDPDRVALVKGTHHGMNVATFAPDWRQGGVAVTTTEEHPAALGPLFILRDQWGVDVRFVGLEGLDDDAIVTAFDAAIADGAGLVSLSHVSWMTGRILPVARIAAIAHERGALVAVDGAQAAGAIPVAPHDIGADFYAFAGQKWLLGPEGLGGLWASPRATAEARQLLAGYPSFEDPMTGRLWSTARRFEYDMVHRPSVVGLARSIGWMSMFIGFDWIHARGRAMAVRAVDLLGAIPGVTVLTPAAAMATLVTFRIEGWPAADAFEELSARIFLIARTIPPLDALRISPAFFTTDEELDTVAEAVELLARHRPDSLPPRRTLTVLG